MIRHDHDETSKKALDISKESSKNFQEFKSIYI